MLRKEYNCFTDHRKGHKDFTEDNSTEEMKTKREESDSYDVNVKKFKREESDSYDVEMEIEREESDSSDVVEENNQLSVLQEQYSKLVDKFLYIFNSLLTLQKARKLREEEPFDEYLRRLRVTLAAMLKKVVSCPPSEAQEINLLEDIDSRGLCIEPLPADRNRNRKIYSRGENLCIILDFLTMLHLRRRDRSFMKYLLRIEGILSAILEEVLSRPSIRRLRWFSQIYLEL